MTIFPMLSPLIVQCRMWENTNYKISPLDIPNQILMKNKVLGDYTFDTLDHL